MEVTAYQNKANVTVPDLITTEDYLRLAKETSFPVEYIAYTLLGCIGVINNAFVVFVILRQKQMRQKLTNLFIVNQSLLDMTASMIFLLSIDDRLNNHTFSGVVGEIYCKLWKSATLLWGCFIGSTYNLTLITIDRYIEVVHAIWHRNHVTKVKAKIAMASVWFLGMLHSLLYLGSTSGMKDGICFIVAFWPSKTASLVAAILDFLFPFVLPVLVMIYSYSRMAYSFRYKVTPVVDKEGSNGTHVVDQQEKKKQAKLLKIRYNIFKTMTLVSICFLLCWVSNQVWFFLVSIGYQLDFTSRFYTFSVFAVYINCSINPFIYIMSYSEFQKAVKEIFIKRQYGQSRESTMSTGQANQDNSRELSMQYSNTDQQNH